MRRLDIFWVYVNLKDLFELSKKSEGVFITPEEIKDVKVTFSVDR